MKAEPYGPNWVRVQSGVTKSIARSRVRTFEFVCVDPATPPWSPPCPYKKRFSNNMVAKVALLISISFGRITSKVKYVKVRDSSYGVPLVNLTTLENSEMCIAVTVCGLCIAGNKHDFFPVLDELELSKNVKRVEIEKHNDQLSVNNCDIKFYETIHTLLDSVSTLYRSAFCSELSLKLGNIEI
eukprot:sb/3471495/